MTKALSIDSNATQLSVAEEVIGQIGVLPVTPDWYPLEPNNYKEFGGDFIKKPRQPIASDRQRHFGALVDLNAMGGYQTDLTQTSLDQIMQAAMFANWRSKNDLLIATAASGHYSPSSGGAAYKTGDIIFGKNFVNAGNNGVKTLAADGTSTSVTAPGVVAETGAKGTISRVGVQFASGDAVLTVASGVPTLSTTARALNTLGLAVGEWVFVGGDGAGNAFSDPDNSAYGRIGSIAANAIVFDKWSQSTPVSDAGTGLTVQLYFGRVIRNELKPQQVHRTLQFERTLGKADDADANEQAEYLIGSSIDQLDFALNTADNVTAEVSLMSQTYKTRNGSVGPKSGNRVFLPSDDAYNTTQHLARFGLSTTTPEAINLFAYGTQGSLTIKNNMKPNKALGVLGAFSHTAGTFEVSLTATEYFVAVATQEAIQNNVKVTVDMILAKNNAGIAIDMPLGSVAGGKLSVALNEVVTSPVTFDAARGNEVDINKPYTLMLSFFDYLPTVAMPGLA